MARVYAKKEITWNTNEQGCHLCTSHYLRPDGYIGYELNGKSIRLHRVIWMKLYGEIPEGLMVCHKCDNRNCINPDHLFLGTHTDNMRDMASKGRTGTRRGTDNNQNKLTEDQVRAIRLDHRPQTEIAKDYGVTNQAIHLIKKRKNWRWLDQCAQV